MIEGAVLEDVRGFLKGRVILTAAELDLFTRLDKEQASADNLARGLECDRRCLTRLLDCLVALQLLSKQDGIYQNTERGALLSSEHPETELPMVLHLNGLWESWGGLTETVRTGTNPKRKPVTERGNDSLKAFIGAMHVVGRGLSQKIADSYNLAPFRRLLDIGGATGTYTIAFLEKNPEMTAVLFDLPDVIPWAEEQLERTGCWSGWNVWQEIFIKMNFPRAVILSCYRRSSIRTVPRRTWRSTRKYTGPFCRAVHYSFATTSWNQLAPTLPRELFLPLTCW
jgi:hypothetical protein